jgi:anti-sigma-K factor RskA
MNRDDRSCHDRADDAAAYAVGALESDEADEYRRHLAWCGTCREELAAFQRLADALPMAVPQYVPPPGLRRRVLRAVRPEPRPRIRRAWAGLAAAAAVATAVVVVGAVLLSASRSVSTRVLAARVVNSPGSAELRIGGGHAELIVRNLPRPAAGRIYEVWLKRGNQAPAPTTALFSVTAGGAADVGVPGGLDGVGEVLVTQEPAGGSRVPTSRAVIVAATS